MSVYSDHPIRLAGNVVHFTAGASESRTLQPGDFFDAIGDVAGGTIQISVEGLDFHNPSFVREVRPRPPSDEIDVETWFNCVTLHVALYQGEGEGALAAEWTTPKGERREGEQEFTAQFDAGEFGPGHTRWRLRVQNRSQKVVTGIGGIGFVRDHHPIGQERLPLRVLNGAFGVVINALAPHAEANGNTVRVGFSQEIADFLHLQGDHPLRQRTIDISPLEAEGELQSIQAEIVPGTKVREAVEARWQQVDAKLAKMQLQLGDLDGTIQRAREKNTEWRDEWLGKVEPDLVAVHITALFSDIDLSTDIIPGFDIDLGSVEDVSIDLFLAFEKIVGHPGHVLLFAAHDYDGAVAAFESLGIMPGVGELLNKLVPAIEEHLPLIHRYFAEVLIRLAPFLSEIPAIFIDAAADETAVLVRWTHDPADQRATRPEPPSTQPIGGVRVRPGLRDVVAGRTPIREGGGEAPDRGPQGGVPAEFALGDPAAVARLDRIDTIVVVMMENRSFDHLLGHLRRERGENYRGFPDNAGNSYQENGFAHAITMEPITNFLRERDVMQIPVDPYHSTRHVAAQMADGAMSGFAQDVLPKGEAQTVLTYYSSEQLPNYYELAADYMVCDQWFSTHPGGTYPNRWAQLSGTMPQLENMHVDDPRLGFIRDGTIFDLLTEAGIGWHYYENNVSMIRMYSRYRLDDRNVLPFDDETEGFEAKAAAGTLPPIVFVEPRITGVPPLEQASDDHPPANLAVGQQFIARVYNALVRTDLARQRWQRTLLLITYDEHGGFYDHVAPPGTPLGPPEWRPVIGADGQTVNKVPKIHPEGAAFMGPRVPTFVISPYVDPGSVSHEVFDHTSIIKTILVLHRQRFFADQFRRFGPRVAMINHLGAALNRDEAREEEPDLLPEPPRRQAVSRRTIPAASRPGAPRRRPTAPPTDDEEARDFRLSLARAMLPKNT